METRTLWHNKFKIIVFCKREGAKLVPLRFDVYYEGRKVNGTLTQAQIDAIEEGLNEHFNTNEILH